MTAHTDVYFVKSKVFVFRILLYTNQCVAGVITIYEFVQPIALRM